MAIQKLTIALHEEQLKEIRGFIAGGQAASVSSFVQHAVGIALNDAADWQEMLEAAMAQTGGPLTDQERAWADAIIDSHSLDSGRSVN
jgi:hypothetical protein